MLLQSRQKVAGKGADGSRKAIEVPLVNGHVVNGHIEIEQEEEDVGGEWMGLDGDDETMEE